MDVRKLVRKHIPAGIRLSRHYVRYYAIMIWHYFYAEKKVLNYKEIPIIINNYNRFTMLKNLMDCLEKRGYNNIFIIDNNSTYPPLLEYYKTIKHKVFLLDKNLGHLSFTKSGIYKKFKNKFFVYTDSDIFLPDDCPDDILRHFYEILVNTPYTGRVGCALHIDDLPDHFMNKEKVIFCESRFWKNKIRDNEYLADIDTTFALYRPNIKVGVSGVGKSIRVAGKYAARHCPWYIDSNNLDDEEQYYISHARQDSSFWTRQVK